MNDHTPKWNPKEKSPKIIKWDPLVNLDNVRKYEISFKLAQQIFDGPFLRKSDHHYGKSFFLAVGLMNEVVICARYEEGKTFYRMLKARRATRIEYENFHTKINNAFPYRW